MSILDLQGMKMPEKVANSSNKSNNRCGNVGGGGKGGGGKGSNLSVTLCPGFVLRKAAHRRIHRRRPRRP